jgi:class 3 adenylate cyclase
VEWGGAEEEDRLATAVTASLHRKVIVGGLLLLTLAPFLDYAAEDTTWAFVFSALGAVAAQGNGTTVAGFAALLANVTVPALDLLEVDGVAYFAQTHARLRPDETLTYTGALPLPLPLAGDGGSSSVSEQQQQQEQQARAVVDARSLSRMWAWEGVLLSLAAFLLFWGLAAALRHDLDRLVFHPLDQMVRLVRRIARNPLAPIRAADDGAAAAVTGAAGVVDEGHRDGGGGGALVWTGSRRGSGAAAMVSARGGPRQGLETALLLQTIGKIGALMRIGLGAAGADIISRNLVLDAAPRQEGLDLRMAGRLVSAVFVFCDVRNFTDATECLQEEVMLFVNKIAAILHELTVRCGGAPNKNVGDAFLLIWKVAAHGENEEEEEENEEEEEEEGAAAGDGADGGRLGPAASDPEAKTRKALAEGPEGALAAGRALYCVLKFGVELARLHAYVCRFSTAASQRLYARLPGYRVGVGFGLHVGWAVEGPIGSAQKIDVSYVSPHVTAAEYLQVGGSGTEFGWEMQ